jgi:8-oxo-dGTP pyrophosphatase MutT (NUDIX family)
VNIDRPGPGEILNQSDEVSVPRQAASVIVLRGGTRTLEVLLVRRTPQARFMGGVWVFPGGAVAAHEGEGVLAHRVAAVRETVEEVGIVLADPAALVKYSRWITPPELMRRFDTHFFLAVVDDDQMATIDGVEIVDHRWTTPTAALEAYVGGEIDMVFPTIKHLEQFSAFDSAAALLEHAARHEVVPVQPRVLVEGEHQRIVLPGEPGYEE